MNNRALATIWALANLPEGDIMALFEGHTFASTNVGAEGV
jgi:hypothetical protein